MWGSAPCASTSWAWRTGRPPPKNCALWKKAWPGAWRKARGISAGLIYKPNKYQSTEELVALAKVAARYDGILDKLAKEGVELPHVAITGGFASEDLVF